MRPIWKRGGVVTPAGRTEGALHGEACRMFFFSFFIALSKKGNFTRQAWLMLLIDLSCWAKHFKCLRLSHSRPFWGYVLLHQHNLR